MRRSDGAPAPCVVVVGVGAVTALGVGARALWEGARAGEVAIRPAVTLDTSALRTTLAAEVVDLPRARPGYRRPVAYRERALDLALVAADEALASGPDPRTVDLDRFGLVLGTCNAGLLAAREWLRVCAAGNEPDPRLATLVTPQGLAEALAGAFGLRGPVQAVNTACASGANAIGLAADLVRQGTADWMLVGGTDALSDVVMAGFSALESLAPTPAAPYCADRSGLSLGEGSGMLLLARADLAADLGLPELAEVGGYGLSADGYHATAPRPDGSGAATAMRAALSNAGAEAAEVGYVNGHGTGTAKNDPAESRAIGAALGDANGSLLVSSTKSVVGHLLGAAGAVEAIVTIGALAHQVAPPTAGYRRADPDCPLDYVARTARPLRTEVAMSNNFAFAGANASIVLRRAGSRRRAPAPAASTDPVVLTGVAALTPAGGDLDAAWDAHRRGRECHHLVDDWRVAEVDVDPSAYLTRRDMRRMDRIAVLGVVSTAQALAHAGLRTQHESSSGVGVVFGTGVGPMEAMEAFVGPLLAHGPAAADPGVFPNTVYNQAAGQIAMHLGLRGPTSTLSVGHATGAAVVSYAADLLRWGHAETVVATVTDTLTRQVVLAYAANGVVSSRPDGAAADGRLALAEGSVSLVLERRSTALARGATVLCEVLGSAMTFDGGPAPHWDRSGRGVERAVCAALAAAGLEHGDIGDIWLAATGLAGADRAEELALRRVFGTGDGSPRRHRPKVALGEPLGSGGALCLALAQRSWRDDAWRDGGPRPALVISASLGGSHAATVLAPPAPGDGRGAP